MPKGVFERPAPPGKIRKAAGTPDVTLPKALEEACRNFETEVGGREELVAHLAHAQLTPDQELIVGAIADPRNDRASLARICYTYGLQFADLLILFRSAGLVKSQLQAMQRVWNLLPDVAGDVMSRAVPHMLPCSVCAGTGKTMEEEQVDGKKVEVEKRCIRCRGQGQVLHQPKLDTQKVALEIGGLHQQGGGVQVNVNQQVAAGTTLQGGFSGFYKDSDRVMYPQQDGEPVEAQVVAKKELPPAFEVEEEY